MGSGGRVYIAELGYGTAVEGWEKAGDTCRVIKPLGLGFRAQREVRRCLGTLVFDWWLVKDGVRGGRGTVLGRRHHGLGRCKLG